MSQPIDIAVVDYGMGNRRSVEKALEHLGVRALVTNDHASLRAADGLVVPGVGAFPRAMLRLRELGLDELLRERLHAGTPVLGVCLGMQLAFDSSTELGGAAGLGILAGEVHALAPTPSPPSPGGASRGGAGDAGALKLPHIGWNEVTFETFPSRDDASEEGEPNSPLLAGLPSRCAFYHVHSFAPVPADANDILGRAEYGAPFVTAVQRGCFYGVQFHPEKSSTAGLRLLANFASICRAAASAPDSSARAASAPDSSDSASAAPAAR
jgi:imidazole glycerol-phosphate synthase subunit HisH